MRICIIGPTHPYRGGIAHHSTLLCKALRQEHDVLFLSYTRQYPAFLYPGASDKDPSDQALALENVEYTLDSINPLTWIGTARRVASFSPDVLIIPWWTVFWTAQTLCIIKLAKWLCRPRVAILCHNSVEHEASAWKITAARLVLSQADHLVTQSRQETARVHELLGEDAPVITGFHPTYAPLSGESIPREQARQRLGLSGNVLLFFGFVRPYKGLDILLQALPRVLANRDATLLVVGEFWKDKERYLELVERLELGRHVRIEDRYVPNEDIATYFAACDLVVQPYVSATGSGISQLAYGLKRPVIATRVGSLDDVIRDGENGRLVTPGDPEELALAIADSLETSTLRTLHQGAFETAQRFTWERLGELLLSRTS